MAILSMRQDFRVPPNGAATSREIYDAALAQFAWADEHGFNALVLSEHHGVPDGWMPSPLTIAAAVLARTKRARVMVSACILPLHDPIRIAEQLAVLDNAFPGRLWVTFGAGYRVEEFEMAGLEHAARGKVLEDHVATVLEALENDVFEWRGTDVSVTPRMITNPRTMLFVGGGVPAAARRAARLKLPMFAMNARPDIKAAYDDEAAQHGFEGGFVIQPSGPTYVFVAEDPEKAWADIGPYVLHEVQTYVSFQTEGQTSLPGVHASTIDDLRASPQYLVGTPEQVVAAIKALPKGSGVTLNPLAGGTPPSIAEPMLELFADKVLPQLTPPSP